MDVKKERESEASGENEKAVEKTFISSAWKVNLPEDPNQITKSPFYYHNDAEYHYRWQFEIRSCSSDVRYGGAKRLNHTMSVNFDFVKNENIKSIQIDLFEMRTSKSEKNREYTAYTVLDIKNNKLVKSAKSTAPLKNIDNKSRFAFELQFEKKFGLQSHSISDADRKWVGPKINLSKDLENLYLSENLRDIEFVIGEQKLFASKLVLSIRSTYFRAMFQNNSIETNTNVIKIEDVDVEVFRDFLRFLHTGSFINLENANKLLVVADKYGQQELLDICEELLVQKLRSENASDMIQLASAHNAHKLFTESINIICDESIEILKSFKNKTDVELKDDSHNIAEIFQFLKSRK